MNLGIFVSCSLLVSFLVFKNDNKNTLFQHILNEMAFGECRVSPTLALMVNQGPRLGLNVILALVDSGAPGCLSG